MAGNYHAPSADSLNNYKNVPNYQSGTWVPKDARFDGKTTNNR